MNPIATLFAQIGEPYAQGLFEEPEKDWFPRYARAQRRFWETLEWPSYAGGTLYPNGRKCLGDLAVLPDYSYTFVLRAEALRRKSEEAFAHMEALPVPHPLIGPHWVGGAGYTHSIPNYGRILQEGLDGYLKRIHRMQNISLREGLLDLIAGIRALHGRGLDHLRQSHAPAALIAAYERVPFSPASSLYEALVCWNFVYYLDFCDNPGRLDADLWPYYQGEDLTQDFADLFRNVDENDGWSGALGPNYNALTLQCLRAVQGMRRPSLELRVTEEMPQAVWDAALDAVLSGGGQPSFYAEKTYQEALKQTFPDISPEDRLRFCGGGCTETMLAGISNVGSLDAGLNVALVFSDYLRDHLRSATDFPSFCEGFLGAVRDALLPLLDQVNAYRKSRAGIRPHPVRTLLVDDCIEREKDFHDGGARCAWSVINVAGLINVIDSLLAVRALVFEEKAFTPQDFLSLLETEDPVFFTRLRSCPCYGVDNPRADALAAEVTARIFSLFRLTGAYPDTQFLPASIQFTTYADAGRGIPATPDGRKADAPLNDSIGPVHGKDMRGPTALLNSALRLPQAMALGTPVLNLRVQKNHGRKALQALIETYLKRGGMQLQISCLSRQDMLEAMEHPDRHQNLIVRIGGYSEYFTRLTPELQKTVLERTEFLA